MNTFVCLLAIAALAQANVRPRNIVVPTKGFGSISNGRIIGGTEAAPNQFPHQVGLFVDGSSFCGGSLISKNYVLTAAHCADGASSIEVVMGAHNVDENEPNQKRMISHDFQVHSGWSWNTLVNDLALIKLPEPAPLSASIQIVKLAQRSDANNDFSGQLATLSGWGKNSDSAPWITYLLQFAQADIITNTECTKYFGSYIKPTTICASGAEGKSTCNGDSGGPLTIVKDGVTRQVGVTSFVSGAGCEARYPHAYSRVSKYLDWIAQHSDAVIDA